MTRGLFVKIFLRLSLAAAGAWLLLQALPRLSVPESAALLIVWSAAVALWTASSLRRILGPLQAAAQSIAPRPEGGDGRDAREGRLSIQESDFVGLAHTLASASEQVQTSLSIATQSRKQLEAVLDSMQDAVLAVSATGRIQWANQRMQRLVPKGPGPRGPGPKDFGSGADWAGVRVGHALVETIRDPEVLGCVRVALDEKRLSVRRSTSLIPGRIFEVNASPVPGGGAVAVLHDVTRIEEVERTQRDFVANVSHELRTPLTSILGYVETLLDGDVSLKPQVRDFLATIHKNAARMTRLTEDLLVMARVESASVSFHPISVSADVLVSDAVKAMSGLLQENSATLEVGEITGLQVIADPDAVLQVLGNLIENAIKYGQGRGEQPTRVIVSAHAVHDPPASVVFRVQDFGAGIASEHLSRIFERFYRVDKTRSRESGGTGLGLAIARHIVQSQGGTIFAESEMNVGSTFSFTLPRASLTTQR